MSGGASSRWVQHRADYSWRLEDDEGFFYAASRSYDNDGQSRWVIAWYCDIAGRPYLTIGGTYPDEESAKAAVERIAVFAP